MKIKTEFHNLSWQPVNPQLIGIRLLTAWSLKTLSVVQYIKRTKCSYRIGGMKRNLIGCSFFSFPSQKFSLFHYFTPKRALFHYFNRKISVTNGHLSTMAIFFCTGSPRLFTVPNFFVRSFRYTASYRHGYLDFQMYRGGGRRGIFFSLPPKPPPPPR